MFTQLTTANRLAIGAIIVPMSQDLGGVAARIRSQEIEVFGEREDSGLIRVAVIRNGLRDSKFEITPQGTIDNFSPYGDEDRALRPDAVLNAVNRDHDRIPKDEAKEMLSYFRGEHTATTWVAGMIAPFSPTPDLKEYIRKILDGTVIAFNVGLEQPLDDSNPDLDPLVSEDNGMLMITVSGRQTAGEDFKMVDLKELSIVLVDSTGSPVEGDRYSTGHLVYPAKIGETYTIRATDSQST